MSAALAGPSRFEIGTADRSVASPTRIGTFTHPESSPCPHTPLGWPHQVWRLPARRLNAMLRALRDAGADAFVVETPWPAERAGEDVAKLRRVLGR